MQVVSGRGAISSRLAPVVMIYWLAISIMALVIKLPTATDLIGADNDDIMRLVEVRDLLGGQGWFDMMQYRLGLADGTLMHWSRLVDLPIAATIKFLSLFMAMPLAEGVAATVWPLLVSLLLFLPLGLAGRRIGGVVTMHLALGIGAILVFTNIKFQPGALDHHNVQLALAMWVTAMLVDPQYRRSSYAVAGIAAALAIAVGAETVPFVAAACICVVLQWAWHGRSFAGAAKAFGLCLTLAISAAFFATVPPYRYAVVTCDNLSFGFYSLTAIGGAGLFILASLPLPDKRLLRFAMLGAAGVALLAAARAIAPECLGNPLANLDPLLVELWLNGVSEARSIVAEMRDTPELVGGFYAVGLFAILVCIARIACRSKVETHVVLLVLLLVSFAVAAIQVRGTIFSNLLSILPLSLLIADIRVCANADRNNPSLAAAYIVTVLASVPVVWGVAGILIKEGVGSVDLNILSTDNAGEEGECGGPQTWSALNALPVGVIASPSNSGAEIIRFTRHRALSAPYHRNQGGMLTELHIGLAQPAESKAFIDGAGVTALTFCKSDPQTERLIAMKPDGLYAALARGDIPPYLQPVATGPLDGFMIYRVVRD